MRLHGIRFAASMHILMAKPDNELQRPVTCVRFLTVNCIMHLNRLMQLSSVMTFDAVAANVIRFVHVHTNNFSL